MDFNKSVNFVFLNNVLICISLWRFELMQKQPPGVFLEISQNSQENTCLWVYFLIKLEALACNFIKKEALAQVFPCEFCEICKNTFSYRIHPVAASINGYL